MENDNRDVSYFVFEAVMARNERILKRLVITVIVCILLAFASNIAWLYAWCQYDYSGSESTTTTYTQSSDGINIIGDNNGVAEDDCKSGKN